MFLCLVRQGESASGGEAPSASVSKETLGVAWLSLCCTPGPWLTHPRLVPESYIHTLICQRRFMGAKFRQMVGFSYPYMPLYLKEPPGWIWCAGEVKAALSVSNAHSSPLSLEGEAFQRSHTSQLLKSKPGSCGGYREAWGADASRSAATSLAAVPQPGQVTPSWLPLPTAW